MSSSGCLKLLTGLFFLLLLTGCNDDFSWLEEHDDPRVEYAPNMYHSVPYQPLKQVTNQSAGSWVDSDGDPFGEYFNSNPYNADASNDYTPMNMRQPAENTIKRGFTPYNIPADSVALASRTVTNPLPATEQIIREGEELYATFCQHCHGSGGDGQGQVGQTMGGVANLNTVVDPTTGGRLTEGHLFHVITHGIRRMGPHGSQIETQDRWKIVHYVQDKFMPEEEEGEGGGDAATDQPASIAEQGSDPAATTASDLPYDPDMAAVGEGLFSQHCSSCHKVNEKLVGPALAGVTERAPSTEWIVQFVHNSQKVIQSGDEYAAQLWEEYKPTQMTSFPFLSEEQVLSIIEYVKQVEAESEAAAPAQADGTAAGGVDAERPGEAGDDVGFSDTKLMMILIVVVLLLVLAMLFVFLTIIKRYLQDREDQLPDSEKDLVRQKYSISAVLRSPGFIGIIIFIFLLVTVQACWKNLMAIGVEQNYQPKQPVPFSHKLHAGENEIDCEYCHTGVTKGRFATIPTVNICMNCHSQIKEGPKFGATGIGTVVEAWEENKPIQWVRVHNLPALSYFNHSQHVVVGDIECQTCHGPVEEMEVVKQWSPLTMGWCINCHRETEVNGKDNAYYDKLYAIHEDEELTAAEIGATDCSRCHY